MLSDPRILVVAATDDRADALCQGLDALGWRTVTARSAASGAATLKDLPLEAALVEVEGLAPGVVTALRDAALPRRLPVIVVGAPGAADAEAADLVMRAMPHPAQAALRLEQLSRAAIAQEEFNLRRQTFAAREVLLSADTETEAPIRVLAAGAADRRFLALSNALTEQGAEVVAAPTPYTAFDYLHESAFDAAILWGGEDHAPALSIASGMKRNTRLYHIPLVLYLRGSGEINLSELYNRGLADVATAETSEDETAARVMGLARTHRRDQAVRRALDAVRTSGLMDPSTGLFTPDLFAAHLTRVAQGSRARKRALSACVLRVADTEAVRAARQGGWLDRAMPQIGAMVSRLVRVEDTAARLASEVFALALPATSGPAARLAAERIAAVIGCTAFDAGPDRSPFVVEFDVGCAELGADVSPAALLELASANLTRRVEV
ncbi:MAG TPA: GGDEF domain-containing protein [Brevundimonas sp.]|uniref:GGDEF domain-containing protein n=1 Tax=Brevundimonas sp. TaxID=1871086 RepID=UPI00260C3E1D|nr:GGDEF domain-containing protein [Brevundimonas sp.]HRO32964.1 GGDEF domain-containing protein [Brevundimonas sp.]